MSYPRFEVTVHQSARATYVIEAPTEDAAREAALELFDEWDADHCSVMSYAAPAPPDSETDFVADRPVENVKTEAV